MRTRMPFRSRAGSTTGEGHPSVTVTPAVAG